MDDYRVDTGFLQTDVCSTVYPRRNFAVMAESAVKHLSHIESRKGGGHRRKSKIPLEALGKFNPEAIEPPCCLIMPRIRFPTLDIGHVIKDILQLNASST